MEKPLKIILVMFSLAILGIANAHANQENVIVMPSESLTRPDIIPKPVDQWFETLDQAKPMRTKLHFYFQDVLSGNNPTVWQVAQAEITPISPTSFGKISMVDDLLTDGPEPDSEVVGRAQGTIGFADLKETATQTSLNIIFTDGEYKGSTISILGRNPIVEKNRELSIVGGTGVFRMASGVAVSSTHSFDANTNCGVLEYTLYIAHYSV